MCLAIPGKIVSLVPDEPHFGVVEVTGVRRRVDLGLLINDMPKIGDWVLIHVGFAMSKISEQDAAEQMQLLTILGEGEAAMKKFEATVSKRSPNSEVQEKAPAAKKTSPCSNSNACPGGTRCDMWTNSAIPN